MKTATESKKTEGSQFVRYFGPLLDALRALGGSGKPDEVVERVYFVRQALCRSS